MCATGFQVIATPRTESLLSLGHVFLLFVLFLSFWFQDREASVNMVLRGECLVKLTHREVFGREVSIDLEAMDLHADSLERYQLIF